MQLTTQSGLVSQVVILTLHPAMPSLGSPLAESPDDGQLAPSARLNRCGYAGADVVVNASRRRKREGGTASMSKHNALSSQQSA